MEVLLSIYACLVWYVCVWCKWVHCRTIQYAMKVKSETRVVPEPAAHWWWRSSWCSLCQHWEPSSHRTLWSAAPASCWLPPGSAPAHKTTQVTSRQAMTGDKWGLADAYIYQSVFIRVVPIHNKSHLMTPSTWSRSKPYSLINLLTETQRFSHEQTTVARKTAF